MAKKITKINVVSSEISLDGLMTIGKLKTGLRTMDFMCCEDVQTEPFTGNFKVQGMRDGNVYMQERAKRQRNHAIFRDDNSSLTLGRDGKYYFYFCMAQESIAEMPEQLVRQATAIAQKVLKELICNN